MNWFDLLLIGGVVQSILLLISLSLIKRGNKSANRYLSFLIVLISAALLSRISFSQNIIRQFPQIFMVPDIVLFILGPTLYLYVRELTRGKKEQLSRAWPHYVFGVLHFALMLFIGARSPQALWELMNSGVLLTPMYIMLGTGFIFNFVYIGFAYQRLFAYQKQSLKSASFLPKITYMHVILGLIETGILIWVISFSVSMIGTGSPDIQLYNYVWVALTFIVYALGFFAVIRPEIFQIVEPNEKYKSSAMGDADVLTLKVKLDELMKTEKPYLNARLTLNDLATLFSMNTTNLSRIINEGFDMNFFDFVNSYRVKDFIMLAQEPKYAHYTFLAIAQEVGFNSKTTFNTAFKKLTQSTPREFIKRNTALGENAMNLQSTLK